MCKLFAVNRLSLNIDEANVIKFTSRYLEDYSLQIPYEDKKI
jgi:hypothetical protein